MPTRGGGPRCVGAVVRLVLGIIAAALATVTRVAPLDGLVKGLRCVHTCLIGQAHGERRVGVDGRLASAPHVSERDSVLAAAGTLIAVHGSAAAAKKH